MRRRNMLIFYASMVVAIVSSVLYHVSQKATPIDAHPAVALLVTYALASCLTLLLLLFFPLRGAPLSELHRLNWSTLVLAISIVGLEVGFLLAYRSGWNVGLAAVLVNVAAGLILVPVAIFRFKETLNSVNLAGVLVCLVGLVMINWNR
jgi:drug/metabolite transporter (DMT)-like permease